MSARVDHAAVNGRAPHTNPSPGTEAPTGDIQTMFVQYKFDWLDWRSRMPAFGGNSSESYGIVLRVKRLRSSCNLMK